MNSKTILKNSLVLGLALFAMLFGAGNLIFPPVIGLESGELWPLGYFVFFLADAGFSLLSICSVIRGKGHMHRITGVLGRPPSVILNTTIIICIGPLLSIPRTAATSFEILSTTCTGGSDNLVPQILFSVVFFAIVLTMAINPSKAVFHIGPVITPILVLTLAVLIVKGIIDPAAPASSSVVPNLIEEGVKNGYQTMNMLGGLAFGIVVVRTLKNFKYKSKNATIKTCILASLIAALVLIFVCSGLAYLGATTGQLWSRQYFDGTINPASLLSNISHALLGSAGEAFLCVIVLLACLASAIGLVSASAEYFHRLINNYSNTKFFRRFLKKQVSYKKCVIAVCILSTGVCNIGLTRIISFSSQVLSFVYPVTLFLILSYLIQKKKHTAHIASKFGAAATLIISTLNLLAHNIHIQAFDFVNYLPLHSFGFNWVVPSIVAAALGLLIEKILSIRNINIQP